MKILLSTDSLKGYGLNRVFEFAKDAGFDGIDLQIEPKDFDTQNAEYLKELEQEYGLQVISIQTPKNANKKKILEYVELTKIVGAKILILQAPKVFNIKFTTWLKTEVPKIRKKESISIALENAPATTLFGFIPEHAMNNLAELKKFKHACLDTSRTADRKEDLIVTLKKLMKYLVHVHISNVKKGRGGHLPNDGILPMESFLTKLSEEDYKGAISIKVKPKYLKIGQDEELAKQLQDSIAYCKKYLTK
ncbi:sugar phosphate isomerase/epimerase [Candidatus Peregrinibacteria bacterium]|jgi:sugar phosphate isomerase/epimerase|nr:sugar phosphate isomerase/epimerase [Candidatus Peregrinibacteria bacterium]